MASIECSFIICVNGFKKILELINGFFIPYLYYVYVCSVDCNDVCTVMKDVNYPTTFSTTCPTNFTYYFTKDIIADFNCKEKSTFFLRSITFDFERNENILLH